MNERIDKEFWKMASILWTLLFLSISASIFGFVFIFNFISGVN